MKQEIKNKIYYILARRYLYLRTESDNANCSLGMVSPIQMGVYGYPKTGAISVNELIDFLFKLHETRQK